MGEEFWRCFSRLGGAQLEKKTSNHPPFLLSSSSPIQANCFFGAAATEISGPLCWLWFLHNSAAIRILFVNGGQPFFIVNGNNTTDSDIGNGNDDNARKPFPAMAASPVERSDDQMICFSSLCIVADPI
ncbi:hypothetical protein MRB53_021276 [Persea americana]|uniref:Uncharacterized protein n=1 Tax=Persea americana TaxID=3435 RepID=A0ACC2L3F1_PERAE|nr:hypothetical protein MRB53_021276 [Persea americana]